MHVHLACIHVRVYICACTCVCVSVSVRVDVGQNDNGKITITIDSCKPFMIHDAITVVNKLCYQYTLAFTYTIVLATAAIDLM